MTHGGIAGAAVRISHITQLEANMATRRYGISRGGAQDTIVEAAGPATVNNVELTIDLAVGMTREDVVLLIDRLSRYILENDFPPVTA
jgi:hypothetical protein